MGMLFRELTGIDHFALDQTWTVFGRSEPDLVEELPPPFHDSGVDPLLFSVENELT